MSKSLQTLVKVIYLIAGANVALGTGEFTLATFGWTPTGWRMAAVAVACIELTFVVLVMAAKEGRIHAAWSLIPLTATAALQVAKVSGELATAKDTPTGALIVVLSMASVLSLTCVVYLFELRKAATPTPAPVATLAMDLTQVANVAERAAAGAVANLQADHAALQLQYATDIADIRAALQAATASPPPRITTRVATASAEDVAADGGAEVLQLTAPSADLMAEIEARRGMLLATAVAELVSLGHSKRAIAEAINRPAYGLSRIKAAEVLN